MDKLGVERRLLTAGENKGFLDPFSPHDRQAAAFAQTMLEQIHKQFIDAVKAGRGKRLKETPSCSAACSGPASRRSRWAWPTRPATSTTLPAK
jgi:ClpP class serine protease